MDNIKLASPLSRKEETKKVHTFDLNCPGNLGNHMCG